MRDTTPPGRPETPSPRRRQPSAQEAKALAHPLRQRIVRLCADEALTNKQLADRLDSEPGTVLPHVRLLLEAGFLQLAEVRTGSSGALEKPYLATGKTWWLDDPLAGAEPDVRFGPVDLAMAEARTVGPAGLAAYATFRLHLSPADVEQLDRRILEILDEYIESDYTRLDRPAHRGLVVLHRVADPAT